MSRRVSTIRWIGCLFGLAASGAALAHTGSPAASGFAGGLAHPFMGLDHLLAMAAVGAWAAQLGRRDRLVVPTTFLAAMAAGAAAAVAGIGLPLVEGLIAASVLALGLLVAFAATASWWWPAALVALFALVHGHAHGAELLASGSVVPGAAGFLAATALLIATGMGVGVLLHARPAILRAGGVAVGVAGSWLLLAAVA